MPFSQPIAVIDIGSNSVRLVIYDGLKRSPMPLFNEKVLCGLAQDMDKTGKLNKNGVERAYLAIQRFVTLSHIMGCETINPFATAAVRDASDGTKFTERIKNSFGLEIPVISGDEEAIYAGLGVLSTITKTDGITGDLGGGSLELITTGKDEVGQRVSFPIGPLRIPLNKSREKLSEFIDENISQFPLSQSLDGKTFYAVGGAFRSLAKVHMNRKNYPLKVIHNYKVSAEDFLNTVQIVYRMSRSSLAKLPGISSKRLGFLPYAALVMDRIIQTGQPKNIIFSASGVREGFLYSKLSNKLKSEDPLISGCSEMMARMNRKPHYGYELNQWMAPLFPEHTVNSQRLRLAACIMSEISCFENTEYRAEMSYRKILDSSLVGLNHKDRVFIAKALYCRYSNYPDEHILSKMQPLLSAQKIQDAQIIGSAMRLGRSLSCSHEGVLRALKLEQGQDTLTLKVEKGYQPLIGEAVQKRVSQLADHMGLEGKVI